jgi:hypothetical protein
MQRPDSDDQARDGKVMFLTAVVDCDGPDGCGGMFEAIWEEESMTLEDMAEPPVADQTCTECGKVHKDLAWPGWCFRSEAG